MPKALFDVSELQQSAALKSKRSLGNVHEQVEWDINLKSSSKRTEPYKFEMEEGTIVIHQQIGATGEPGKIESGTGSALWTAAVGLTRFLEHSHKANIHGKSVIELGCGTGLVSIAAATWGAHVVATDIQQCLDSHTIPNIARNFESLEVKGKLDTKELLWGEASFHQSFSKEWDMVVASDVVYRSEHVLILFETLCRLVGTKTDCFVAYDKRGREGIKSFLELCSSADSPFCIEHVSPNSMPEGFRFTHFGLIKIKRS